MSIVKGTSNRYGEGLETSWENFPVKRSQGWEADVQIMSPKENLRAGGTQQDPQREADG